MTVYPVLSIEDIMFKDDDVNEEESIDNDISETNIKYNLYQRKFEAQMKALEWKTCCNCKGTFLKTRTTQYLKCIQGKNCHLYTAENDMDPGEIPPELQNLSPVEQQLISRIHTCMSVQKLKCGKNKRGHQLGYKGNIINFAQDVSSIAKELPCKISKLPSIITIRRKDKIRHSDFFVRSKKVRDALIWLKNNNRYYFDIIISEENLSELPENDSVYTSLQGFEVNENIDDDQDNGNEDDQNEENEEPCDVEDDIYESFVPNISVPKQDDQVKNIFEWPTIDSEPVNEFKTEGIVSMAFPSLFPTGAAELRTKAYGENYCPPDGTSCRKTHVSHKQYFKHLLRFHDRRFAQHPTFRFFAMNCLLRWELLNEGHAFVKRNSEFSSMSKEELKCQIEKNPNVLKKIMFQGRNIRGSKPYWKQRQHELNAMIEQLGLPSLFITLSAADLHWPDLFKLLCPGKDFSSLSSYDRQQLVKDNPAIVDEFFSERVESFIKDVLVPKFKIKDYWYRIEYQHRGSPHVHGVFWVENAPDVTNVTDINSEEAERVLKFYDELISTMNPDENEREQNPCQIRLEDVDDHEKDLARLLNRVQRHTQHSDGYCWRYNKKKKEKACRFNFPMEIQTESKLDYDDAGRIIFVSKRNDAILNRYNGYILSTWKANIDISPVISKEALISYIAKYITKAETKSSDFNEILKNVVEHIDKKQTALQCIQSILIKLCSERDFSAQEVCHIVMGSPYYSCGHREFMTVNFNEMNKVNITKSKQNPESLIDKYRKRGDQFNDLSLYEMAKNYIMPSGRKRKTGKEAIILVYPKLYEGVEMDSNHDYYKNLVLLHVPWKESLKKFEDKKKSWKELYEEYNVGLKVQSIINHSSLQAEIESVEEEYDTFEPVTESITDEDWINVAGMQPHKNVKETDLGFRDIDKQHNWHGISEKYKKYGSIKDLQNFIKNQQKVCGINSEEIDVPFVKYNREQKQVLNLLRRQIDELKYQQSKDCPR